jgi:hypothetical protein
LDVGKIRSHSFPQSMFGCNGPPPTNGFTPADQDGV